MAKEIFRLHRGTGLIVSSFGRVLMRCQDNRFFKFTYGTDTKKGYKRVHYKGKIKLVHRLVAEAFIPNIEHKSTVDHIDRDRSNNHVENLRWADSHEQSLNSSKFKDKAMWKKTKKNTLSNGNARICVVLPDGRKSAMNIPIELAEVIYHLTASERYLKIMEYRNGNQS